MDRQLGAWLLRQGTAALHVWPARGGVVRMNQHGYADDDGPYLSLGCSMFWLVWGWKFDRARTMNNLEWLRACGTQYVRAFGVVGPTGGWEDRTIDPWWPDYGDVLGDVSTYVRSLGMRVQWTIFASVDLTPTPADRASVVQKVLAAVEARPDAVEAFEIVNEADHTGWAGHYDELRTHAETVRQRGWGVVSLSSPLELHDPLAPATERSNHYDRSSGGEGGAWRYVRQPWEGRPPGRNNEPKGPQSSVEPDDDPVRQTMAAYVTWLASGTSHVVHPGAGVRGGGQADLDRTPPRPANFYDTPHLEAILRGCARGAAMLPPDLPNWPMRVHSNPKYQGTFPWETKPLEPLFDTHYMRIYVALKGDRFIALPLKIQGAIPLQAIRPQQLTIYHPVSWVVLQTVTLSQGETLTLDPSWCPGGVVIVGQYV